MQLLVNHVAEGHYPSATVLAALEGENLESPGASVTTLLDETLTVRQDGMCPAGIYVNAAGQEVPGAKVITADIETCAGVIHIIDKVLVAGGAGTQPSDVTRQMIPRSNWTRMLKSVVAACRDSFAAHDTTAKQLCVPFCEVLVSSTVRQEW